MLLNDKQKEDVIKVNELVSLIISDYTNESFKTLGELVSFEPSITVFDRDTILTNTIYKSPKWSFGAGLYYGQGKIQPSVNLGYKGFQVGYTNGIYLTKQWNLK